MGLDCGNLFDGFAAKYNSRYGGSLPETTEGNITATAYFSNLAIEDGAIMTLSAHMPNFAFSEEKENTTGKTYDRYDYLAADSYNLSGDCMNQILPGGAYHERFNAYLDMVAEYAHQVDGTILFRPFHENTGSWFWWGKAFCEPETYKSVFKYTVEYLRDEKDVHNILYVYGPGSEAATLAEYEERYPGDAYVDMVGFDTYDSNPVTDEEGYTFQTNFENTVRLTDEFAKLHGKLFAVTETGITSDQGGLPAVGNKRPDWFMKILDIVTKEEYNCCYFMIWTNYSDSSYYTPFVASVKEDGTLHGHEMINEFIEFYNDEKSIFASDQKEILNGPAPSAPQRQGWDEADGYFTAPIAGTRILKETAVQARLNRECGDVVIKAAAGDKEIPLSVSVSGKTAHAVLTDEILKELGETVSGRLILYVEGARRQEIPVIFNIAEAERDPLCVDDFERYYGSSELLNSSWAVNKDSGCELALTLANDGTVPVKVTIPFTDFVERDTPGNPAGGLAQDKTSVTSFGLWVNAIPGSDAIGEDGMVSGTIIYDKITALSAGVTEAVFEEVKAEDPDDPNPDDPNPDTPDPDDPNPDDQNPQKPGTGSDGNDDPASGADSGNDAEKPSSDENKAAQTEDDANCMPYAAGVLAAGIAAAGTAVYRRRMK